MRHLLLNKALLLAISVTTTDSQTYQALTSAVQIFREGGEIEEVKLGVPSQGAQLLPAARRHVGNFTELVAMQRYSTPDCAVQANGEANRDSDGCEEVVIQRLCQSMAMVRLRAFNIHSFAMPFC